MRPLGRSPGWRWQLGPPLPLIRGCLCPSGRTRDSGRASLPGAELLPEVGAGAGAGRGHVLVHDDHEEESEHRRQQPLVEPFIHGPALRPAGEVAAAAAARSGACSEVSGTPGRGSEPAAPPCPCRRRARLSDCPAALRGWRSRGLGAEPGRRAPAAAAAAAAAMAWGSSRSLGRRAPAGSSRSRARSSQATRSIPPPVRRRSGAAVQGSGPRPSRGSCGGEHRDCMRLSRAPAKGEGSARPRSPSPPYAPRPAPSPASPRAPGARRKFAKPPLGGGEQDASAEPPPGRIALLLRVRPPRRRQRAHTRSRGLAPPQPASRCDKSPGTRSKKTCPRYGACAKAFLSPGGVSRGGVHGSAGLSGGSWGWESLQPRAWGDLAERLPRSENRPHGGRC